MASFESKPGFGGVIEVLRVEGSDVRIDAAVLLMAGFTVAADFPVDAFLGRDPLADGLMTGQAALRVDLHFLGVAFLAVGSAFQDAVRLGERPWRGDGLTLWVLGRQAGEEQK
jgi:hypothetical protein